MFINRNIIKIMVITFLIVVIAIVIGWFFRDRIKSLFGRSSGSMTLNHSKFNQSRQSGGKQASDADTTSARPHTTSDDNKNPTILSQTINNLSSMLTTSSNTKENEEDNKATTNSHTEPEQ